MTSPANPYGQPQPYGYAQPGMPPTPPVPPKKRNRWLLPALLGGGLALVLCCGGVVAMNAGDDSPGSSADGLVSGEAAATGAAGGAPTGGPENAGEQDEPADDGLATAKVGQTITIRGGLLDGDEIAFTVKSVKAAKSDNMFTQPGSGKKFVAADISVLMKSGSALMTGHEITLQGSDGEVYNNQFVVHDDAFEWTNLSAGQRKSGLVFFEVPKAYALKGTKVLVQDFWDQKPAGQWML